MKNLKQVTLPNLGRGHDGWPGPINTYDNASGPYDMMLVSSPKLSNNNMEERVRRLSFIFQADETDLDASLLNGTDWWVILFLVLWSLVAVASTCLSCTTREPHMTRIS